MICRAEHIEQPYSGEYTEKIYDVNSPWNSGNWTWIKFEDENDEWCGEFRGKYRGVAISKKLGIVVVLTSDYVYVLDSKTTDVIELYSQSEYIDITTSPYDEILITDGYGIGKFTNEKIADLEFLDIPIHPDNLRFVEWNGDNLKICCYEFLKWGREIEMYWDCVSMEWSDIL